jgi:hypothetical protein
MKNIYLDNTKQNCIDPQSTAEGKSGMISNEENNQKTLSEKELHTLIVEWCNENPYTLYADYRDQLPQDLIAPLLQAKTIEELQEAQCNLECEVSDCFFDYQYTVEHENFETMQKELSLTFDSEEEKEAAFEVFRENFQFCTDDYIKTCARNTRLNVVAVPLLNGEAIESPQADYSDTDLPEFKATIAPLFGFSDADCDDLANEQYGLMKICGQINIEALLAADAKPLTHITITPLDSYVFHNGSDGSGSCFEPKITKEVTLPCTLHIDSENRYGVQAVYGFTNAFWNNDLNVR